MPAQATVPRTAVRAREFVVRSTPRALLALGRDWGAIVLIAWLSEALHNPLAYVAAAWAIGLFQFALGEAMLHEASHYNLFPARRWNVWLESLYALPFLRTISQFQAEHNLHHRRLGSPEDHLNEDYYEYGVTRPPQKWFWLWFLKPATGYAGWFYLRTLSPRPWRSGVRVAAFWTVAAGAFWATGSLRLLVLYWLVPFFWCFASFLYWSEIQDHCNTASGTRSNLSPLTNLLTHNNGYHYIHHLFPAIPWYRLPEAYAALCPGEGDVSHGFLDTYRQIRGAPAEAREERPALAATA
jgi:fatty acid desaturase